MNITRHIRPVIASGIFACTAALCHAQSTNLLYAAPSSGARDNYPGAVGCSFKVAHTFVVSHLGYYSTNISTGLATSHQVGLFTGSGGSHPPLYGQVIVPAGTNGYFMSNYYWVALNPPLIVVSNSTYCIAGQAASGDGDFWKDDYAATWNAAIVTATNNSGGQAVYGPGAGAWPPTSLGNNGASDTYGAPNLANIPIGPAYVGVLSTNVSTTVGTTLSVIGFGTGQLPISYQWYTLAGSPMSGQTNATMVISNVPQADSGTYYLIASNSLGFEQSSNVTVSITANPVVITQQPTNLTVFQNYPATYSVTNTGSQPISYQWLRNGAPISGATANSYSFAAALTNNGDTYSCTITNSISSTNTVNVSLTVVPNLAPPAEYLHGAFANSTTNSFSGLVGGVFMSGTTPALVSHLGFFAVNFTDSTQTNATLSGEHHVGLFSGDGTILYASVDIQPGTYGVTNGYIWAPLSPGFVLATNTSYLLLAEGGSDHWGDTYLIPDINPYYVGTNTSVAAIYTGGSWPTAGTLYGRYGGQMYSAPNLALLPVGISVGIQQTNVTQYAGVDTTLSAYVGGQPPVTLQWYEEPGTPLSGDTNLLLDLGNITTNQAGNYFAIVSNSVTGANAQSVDAVVNVLGDAPVITQDIQSQTAYDYSTVQFSASLNGRPPLRYQWTFNGNPIAGATTNTLTLNDVSSANVGNYQLFVTNAYGSTNSSVANLQVTYPVWGGYASGVMTSNLLLYYRFSDISNYVNNSSANTAVNQGSFGAAANGTYEGGCAEIPGPTNILDLDEPTNLAVSMDGYDTDILVPSGGNFTVTNCTMAAWVYDTSNPEAPNAAIFFHRQGSVFGLSVNPDSNNIDQLRVTWTTAHDSFIELPPNQWVLVAAVVTPTNIAVYMNNGSNTVSTNLPSSNAAASFNGVSYVGYDTAGSSRRWTGGLDEVMVFNEALTPSQINSLYLGVPQTATLTITPSAGGKYVVTWPGGTLQETTNLTGGFWSTTSGASNGVYQVSPAGAAKYYRVKLQ